MKKPGLLLFFIFFLLAVAGFLIFLSVNKIPARAKLVQRGGLRLITRSGYDGKGPVKN